MDVFFSGKQKVGNYVVRYVPLASILTSKAIILIKDLLFDLLRTKNITVFYLLTITLLYLVNNLGLVSPVTDNAIRN